MCADNVGRNLFGVGLQNDLPGCSFSCTCALFLPKFCIVVRRPSLSWHCCHLPRRLHPGGMRKQAETGNRGAAPPLRSLPVVFFYPFCVCLEAPSYHASMGGQHWMCQDGATRLGSRLLEG